MKLYEKHQDMEKAITEYSSKKIKIWEQKF
jgi:hypothetical protein